MPKGRVWTSPRHRPAIQPATLAAKVEAAAGNAQKAQANARERRESGGWRRTATRPEAAYWTPDTKRLHQQGWEGWWRSPAVNGWTTEEVKNTWRSPGDGPPQRRVKLLDVDDRVAELLFKALLRKAFFKLHWPEHEWARKRESPSAREQLSCPWEQTGKQRRAQPPGTTILPSLLLSSLSSRRAGSGGASLDALPVPDNG